MKYAKILITLVLVFALSSVASAKKKSEPKKVYAFGVAASFTDSIVYYTPIQLLDEVYTDHNGFLPNRDLYSYQLKNHFEQEMNEQNRICMIYFSTTRKKLEKEQTKLIAKYKKNKNLVIQPLPSENFEFKKPDIGE